MAASVSSIEHCVSLPSNDNSPSHSCRGKWLDGCPPNDFIFARRRGLTNALIPPSPKLPRVWFGNWRQAQSIPRETRNKRGGRIDFAMMVVIDLS